MRVVVISHVTSVQNAAPPSLLPRRNIWTSSTSKPAPSTTRWSSPPHIRTGLRRQYPGARSVETSTASRGVPNSAAYDMVRGSRAWSHLAACQLTPVVTQVFADRVLTVIAWHREPIARNGSRFRAAFTFGATLDSRRGERDGNYFEPRSIRQCLRPDGMVTSRDSYRAGPHVAG